MDKAISYIAEYKDLHCYCRPNLFVPWLCTQREGHITPQASRSCRKWKKDFKCQSTSPVHQSSPLVQSSDCRQPRNIMWLLYLDLIAQLMKRLTYWRVYSASGPDGESAWMLCTFPTELAPSIVSLFNLSLKTGKLPDGDWQVLFRSQRTQIFGTTVLQ